jgi:hypothetical protein
MIAILGRMGFVDHGGMEEANDGAYAIRPVRITPFASPRRIYTSSTPGLSIV